MSGLQISAQMGVQLNSPHHGYMRNRYALDTKKLLRISLISRMNGEDFSEIPRTMRSIPIPIPTPTPIYPV